MVMTGNATCACTGHYQLTLPADLYLYIVHFFAGVVRETGLNISSLLVELDKLEAECDKLHVERMKSVHRHHLDTYREERHRELALLKTSMEKSHTESRKVRAIQECLALKERHTTFSEEFRQDMSSYRQTGGFSVRQVQTAPLDTLESSALDSFVPDEDSDLSSFLGPSSQPTSLDSSQLDSLDYNKLAGLDSSQLDSLDSSQLNSLDSNHLNSADANQLTSSHSNQAFGVDSNQSFCIDSSQTTSIEFTQPVPYISLDSSQSANIEFNQPGAINSLVSSEPVNVDCSQTEGLAVNSAACENTEFSDELKECVEDIQ